MFRFKLKSEFRPRAVDMGFAGPWTWNEVRAKLVVLLGSHVITRRMNYVLKFSQIGGGSVEEHALPMTYYVVQRLPMHESRAIHMYTRNR